LDLVIRSDTAVVDIVIEGKDNGQVGAWRFCLTYSDG
jgi:hypothetical protein